MISVLPTILAALVLVALISRNHAAVDKLAAAYVLMQGLLSLLYSLSTHVIYRPADGAGRFEVFYAALSFAVALALLFSGLGLFNRWRNSRALAIGALLFLGSGMLIEHREIITEATPLLVLFLAPFGVALALGRVAWSKRQGDKNAT